LSRFPRQSELVRRTRVAVREDSPLILQKWRESLRENPRSRGSLGVKIVADGGDRPRSAGVSPRRIVNLRGMEQPTLAMRRSGVRIPSAPPRKPCLTCGNAAGPCACPCCRCSPYVPPQRMQRVVRRSPGRGSVGCLVAAAVSGCHELRRVARVRAHRREKVTHGALR
jgi:hypothetical protein